MEGLAERQGTGGGEERVDEIKMQYIHVWKYHNEVMCYCNNGSIRKLKCFEI